MMVPLSRNHAKPRRCAGRLARRLAGAGFGALLAVMPAAAADDPIVQSFKQDIQPVLDQYCYDCHGYGSRKGGVSLEDFAGAAALHDHPLWLRALKNVRAGIMPPADAPRLPPAEAEKLMAWIKREAFSLDPAHPDPGRVTVRRLNRVEYRNTVRELTGVDVDTQKEFPPDDTGHGFDNIGDVLTISPMLLEKYLDAAQAVIAKAVPTQPKVVAEHTVLGRAFAPAPVAGAEAAPAPASGPPPAAPALAHPAPAVAGNALDLSYYTPATVGTKHRAQFAGKYQVAVNLTAIEHYVDDQFDYNRCRLTFKADGQTLLAEEYVREGEGKAYEYVFDRDWAAGDHELTFELEPVGPAQDQKRQLRLRLNAVTVRGPFTQEHWVQPRNYAKFFPRPVPADAGARRAYARELLGNFASRAFRRPVDEATVDRLGKMAEAIAAQPGNSFESGVAQAMVAVLASPRFIFREEAVEPARPGQPYPLIDEYALASRLSYFFWSSMPDAELFRLAGAGRLRAELPAQLDRMMKDPRAAEFVRNFTGQWLEARDIPTVQINAVQVYLREHPDPAFEQAQEVFQKIIPIAEDQRTPEQKAAFATARTAFRTFIRSPKPQLSPELRDAMQHESELVFGYIVHEDRSLLELLESDYTFLNEDLAHHYGIAGVAGREMRRVTLPPDSPRGGVLTQGTVLVVTSNPTRTSPVKRGVFILDSILGTKPAPPPPNIPPLENAGTKEQLRSMTLRETLALHAKNGACRSCHNRMDPPGLALENFNAMGMWRDTELDRPIETAGHLITGETFANIRELKHVLATAHRRDFYYCLSEKLLIYALGRGLEYYDIATLDQLVAGLEATGGKPSVLLQGIVNSAPFQQRRPDPAAQAAEAGAGGNSVAPLTKLPR